MKDVNATARRILILGGGFGGISAALRLEKRFARDPSVHITLINRDNYILFTPMLPEVTASSIEAKHIITPIRAFFRKVRFHNSEIESIDLQARTVKARHCPHCMSHIYEYDHLLLALGSVTGSFRLGWVKEHAFQFKTLEDAMVLRNHVIDVLEHADMEPDPEVRRKLLTVVVAGAGLAGVELAAELYDFFRRAQRFYPDIKQEEVSLTLVERGSRIMPAIPEDLATYTHRCLVKRGVDIRTSTSIVGATPEGVDLDDGSHIPTRTLVWSAGVVPNPLLETLPCPREKGKILVEEHLEVPGYQGVWAIGDNAHVIDKKTGKPQPPMAQHAVREGKLAAENIAASISDRPKKHFIYSAVGQLVPLGRRTAIAEILGLKFRGFFAWWL